MWSLKINRISVRKKLLCLLLALTCAFSVVLPYSPVASADESLEDLKNQYNQIEKEIQKNEEAYAEAQSDIKSNKKKLDSLNDQLDSISKQVDLLNESIDILNKDIDALQSDIDVTQQDIETINAQIIETEIMISETNMLMNSTKDVLLARIRESYMAGEASTVELLLSSGNLATFFARKELVTRISENDKKLIDELSEKINQLNDLQVQLEESKAELEGKKTELDTQMDKLDSRQDELQTNKKDQVKKQKVAADKYNEVQDIIKDLDKESAEYKAQIKKQQAERDALEAEIDAYIKEHASSEGDVPEEEYGNDGELAWPVKERCTITAGYPTYPSGGKHYGIDICLCTASGSTRDSGGNSLSLGQPYYAAQGGEVIIAGWHKSFGNYVVVDHGDGRQTLYAHSSSLSVSVGDIVKKGQQLGLIGSTGNSTGPHLHFEVRVKKADGSTSRENPLNHVSKPSYYVKTVV